MEVKTLYRYRDDHGRTVVSPSRPETAGYTTACRLIADAGMALTKDGSNFCACVDADSPDGWREVPHADDGMTEPDMPTRADYEAALNEMGVE